MTDIGKSNQRPVGFYLSFADDDAFRGGIIAYPASEFIEAVKECHRRGINPGGEVLAVPIFEHPPDHHPLWKLMDYDAMAALDGVDALTHVDTPGDSICERCNLPVMLPEDNAKEAPS